MKQYIRRGIGILVALFTFAAVIGAGADIAYAAPNIPQIIKVGLSYNNAANNNFAIKSDGGLKVSIINGAAPNELFTHPGATGLVIRKDVYYNIVNNKETEINYEKQLYTMENWRGPITFRSERSILTSMLPNRLSIVCLL